MIITVLFLDGQEWSSCFYVSYLSRDLQIHPPSINFALAWFNYVVSGKRELVNYPCGGHFSEELDVLSVEDALTFYSRDVLII